jgi:hypothetical protein
MWIFLKCEKALCFLANYDLKRLLLYTVYKKLIDKIRICHTPECFYFGVYMFNHNPPPRKLFIILKRN